MFIAKTIKKAFSAIEIYSFNPNVISPAQIKPSESTSTQGLFTNILPSLVCTIISAPCKNPITAFDTDSSMHQTLPLPNNDHPPCLDATDSSKHMNTPTYLSELQTHCNLIPYTPQHHMHANTIIHSLSQSLGIGSHRGLGRRWHQDKFDEATFFEDTLSKYVCLISTSLSQTVSGSFLLLKIIVTSHVTLLAPIFGQVTTLPDIDWSILNSTMMLANAKNKNVLTELSHLCSTIQLSHQHILARNNIIITTNVQMVPQQLHLDKLN